MIKEQFHESAGLIKFIPTEPPSFQATLKTAWGCAASRSVYNCYTYALDIPDHGSGSPGWLHLTDNEKWNAIHAASPRSLHNNLLKDGLEFIQQIPADVTGCHFIAAFFKEAEDDDMKGETSDWHFYRLDDDGNWSHKRGKNNVPEKLHGISLQEDALRRSYKFVGYYKVPSSGIQYYQNYYWNPDMQPA